MPFSSKSFEQRRQRDREHRRRLRRQRRPDLFPEFWWERLQEDEDVGFLQGAGGEGLWGSSWRQHNDMVNLSNWINQQRIDFGPPDSRFENPEAFQEVTTKALISNISLRNPPKAAFLKWLQQHPEEFEDVFEDSANGLEYILRLNTAWREARDRAKLEQEAWYKTFPAAVGAAALSPLSLIPGTQISGAIGRSALRAGAAGVPVAATQSSLIYATQTEKPAAEIWQEAMWGGIISGAFGGAGAGLIRAAPSIKRGYQRGRELFTPKQIEQGKQRLINAVEETNPLDDWGVVADYYYSPGEGVRTGANRGRR